MSPIRLLLFASLTVLVHLPLHAQARLDGNVTAVGTAGSFELNGVKILCTAETKEKDSEGARHGCADRVYGERLLVHGERDKQTHAITAASIESMDGVYGDKVTGLALIDHVLGPNTLSADGYAIRIIPETKKEWEAPLTFESPLEVNQWIRYIATRDQDGSLIATSLYFAESVVSPKEQHLREKGNFDAAAVSEKQRQSSADRFLAGTDYKRLPAVQDDEQGPRIQRIGARLIPEYLQQLDALDPNRIDIHFQLVDSDIPGCVNFANGLILVPVALTNVLSDDELAAVIADNLAEVLEKKDYRYMPAATMSRYAPLAGLSGLAGSHVAMSLITRRQQEQSGRLSLVLLHDGGFDIHAAPLVWWHLMTGQPNYMTRPMPYRSAYLFQVLASGWRPTSLLPALPLNQSHSSAAQ